METVGHLLRDILNLLFPPVCAVCRVRLDARCQQGLCSRCASSIGYLKHPLCRVCGTELAGAAGREYLCGECLRTPPAFCLARSLARYEPIVRQLVQRLKYAGDTSVVHGISAVVRGADLSEFDDCDWIIPVPLHVKRHRIRGLNQATFLAGLFFPDKIPSVRPEWLFRTRNTVAQTRLSGYERRKNLAGAFGVRPGNQLKGSLVCLVDDVYTTGTTVGACATALLGHEARGVKVLTLARVSVPQRGRMD
jgi:ComF family protein